MTFAEPATPTHQRPSLDRASASPPSGFASTVHIEREQLLQAPVRWPRQSALAAPLPLTGRPAHGAATLGLHTVGDLLEHVPRDRREARTVGSLRPAEQATIAVEVRSISSRPVRRRGLRPLVEARVFDTTGSTLAVFFNQPWLVDRYPPGTLLVLHGTAQPRRRFRVDSHAVGDGVGGDADTEVGAVVGHYPASDGINSTQILTLVRGVAHAFHDVMDPLPAAVRLDEKMPDRPAALAAMHFPRGEQEATQARERLAFEELMLAQVLFLRRRARRRLLAGAPRLDEPASLSQRWLAALPFDLTGDQRAAIEAIDADIAGARPMQRLLMGEVGSGKTVVALHAMLRAVEHGRQAALMAPTETLAEQHFATLQSLMGAEPITCALLTGSTPARRRADALGKLASGELSLIVGTHALIEPDVRFRSLAVVVVDEQHRFGVRQRAALDGKAAAEDGTGAVRDGAGDPPADDLAAIPAPSTNAPAAHTPATNAPHVLHMTATPIPRTLALARYADLDRTYLRELPAGRRPITTRIVAGDAGRERAYEDLRAQLRQGRQAYVVCPLVEEPDEDAIALMPDARAATAELQRLRDGELKGFNLTLLHGQMTSKAKQQAIGAFAGGAADVLVATTVIEVGIDVPNATVMLIENAERFGISQLHQLRGRIGRGGHESTCLLAGPASSSRLRALVTHSDGFELAEIDLRLRGAGELAGTRQSGTGQFRFARLPDDRELLSKAHAWAKAIIAADPELRDSAHVLIADALTAAGAQPQAPLPA